MYVIQLWTDFAVMFAFVTACLPTGASYEHSIVYQQLYNVIEDVNIDNDVKPIFRHTPQNVSVNIGQRAILRCRVDNLGAKIVTWRREGEIHPLTIGLFTFVSDTRVAIEFNKRTAEWCLMIHDVRPTDEGLYKCQVNAKDDQHNFYNIFLHVRRLLVTGTEVVERGASIRLVCNVTGRFEPPHNVDWFKDSRLIESDDQAGLIITKKIEATVLISVLQIRRSKMTDAGEYFCRSSDGDVGFMVVRIVSAPVEKRGTSAKIISNAAAAVKQRIIDVTVHGLVTLAAVTSAELFLHPMNELFFLPPVCSFMIRTLLPVTLFQLT